MTALAVEQRHDDDLIRCRGCDMPIARRYDSGDVRAIVKGEYVDKRGRFVIPCPVCGERNCVKVTQRF